jgi:hypothetical protein
MRADASLVPGEYHSPAEYHKCRVAYGTAKAPRVVIELSNNVMQLTKGGWMRMDASSSARSS